MDNDSRLKLCIDELKRHYMRHLFLQVLGLPNEVSLYVLDVGFRHSRATLFDIYMAPFCGLDAPDVEIDSYNLPDRFINGVVLYRYAGYAMSNGIISEKENVRLISEAKRLLEEKDDKQLSAEELSTLGRLGYYFSGKDPMSVERAGIINYHKRASLLGSLESTLFLANSYQHGLYGFKVDTTEAFRYYKRGYEMNCPESTTAIAALISRIPSFAPELSSITLYQKAASLGNKFARVKCYANNYPY